MSLLSEYPDFANQDRDGLTRSVEHYEGGTASAPGASRAAPAAVDGCDPSPDARPGQVAKRALDLSLATLLVLAFAPLAAIVAALIRLSGPGPVVFCHSRIGRAGRPFPCLKFRTMHIDADARLGALLASDPALAREWTEHQKLRVDPRVTSIGRILRATSLDELPQLINVLLGDMSLVGPRPVTPSELQRYGAAAALYIQVRPGLTGAWQVSGRNLVSYDTRVCLDREYIANWRLATDLRILARTPGVVLLRRGAL